MPQQMGMMCAHAQPRVFQHPRHSPPQRVRAVFPPFFGVMNAPILARLYILLTPLHIFLIALVGRILMNAVVSTKVVQKSVKAYGTMPKGSLGNINKFQ